MKRLYHIIRDVIVVAIVAMLATLVVGLCTMQFDGITTPSGAYTDFGFMATYFFSMLLIYLIVTRYERSSYKIIIPISHRRAGFDPTTILWGVILLIAMSIALMPLAEHLPADDRTFHNGEWTLLTTVVLAPIFEEYIFRGRLISLFQHNMPPSIAVLLAATVFAFSHGINVVTLSAFVSGIVFGYAYLLRRSIIAPIILHMCNNAIAYALIVLSYQDKPLEEILDSSVSYTSIYIAASAIIVIGIVHIIYTLRRADREARAITIESETPAQESAQASSNHNGMNSAE